VPTSKRSMTSKSSTLRLLFQLQLEGEIVRWLTVLLVATSCMARSCFKIKPWKNNFKWNRESTKLTFGEVAYRSLPFILRVAVLYFVDSV
jgi:hypothetical protein